VFVGIVVFAVNVWLTIRPTPRSGSITTLAARVLT
jgi:hypothetical protein